MHLLFTYPTLRSSLLFQDKLGNALPPHTSIKINFVQFCKGLSMFIDLAIDQLTQKIVDDTKNSYNLCF